MKKRTKIILGSVFVLIVLIIIISYISIVSSKTIIAQIDVEGGTVLVNGNQISESMKLSQGDIIETGSDGLATVVLYESIVINLEENTKISLEDLTKENPTISRESGSIFSQITNLLGIDSYTVKSGNSVASVRGTSFAIEDDKIFVGNGEVKYEIEGQQFNVVKGKAVEKINGQIMERELTAEEKEKINKLTLRAIEGLKRLREKELKKHPNVLNMVKKSNGLTDKDISEGLESADKGEINLADFKNKVPIKIDSVDKVIKITDQIRELKTKLF